MTNYDAWDSWTDNRHRDGKFIGSFHIKTLPFNYCSRNLKIKKGGRENLHWMTILQIVYPQISRLIFSTSHQQIPDAYLGKGFQPYPLISSPPCWHQPIPHPTPAHPSLFKDISSSFRRNKGLIMCALG